jgi:hypothetical protein
MNSLFSDTTTMHAFGYLVVPTTFGYDDESYYPDSGSLGETPLGLFTSREEAEAVATLHLVNAFRMSEHALMSGTSVVQELTEAECVRVQEILQLKPMTNPCEELLDYFYDCPDCPEDLTDDEIRELIEILAIEPLSILTVAVDSQEQLVSLQARFAANHEDEEFQKELADAFGLSIPKEYDPEDYQ